MAKIYIYDSLGSELDHLTQWDENQSIEIEGVLTNPAPCVQFCNLDSETTISSDGEITNGRVKVMIPNSLLQQRFPIRGYLYYQFSDGSKRTMYEIKIPMNPRTRPEIVEL